MGKIRIKALGDEKKEKAQKQRDQARREGKKIAKLKDKDGGRVVEMEGVEVPEQETLPLPSQTSPQPSPTRKGSTQGEVKKRERSQRYIKARSFIDKTKSYTLADALELVKKTGLAKFDPTVELHINTVEKGIKGNVVEKPGPGHNLSNLATVSGFIFTPEIFEA
ncbi:MAG: hypothetical protein M1120_02945, partial [Patescibacteria group bacterium]|nr:hypothetical protein [Patescibacteria group bacterium]